MYLLINAATVLIWFIYSLIIRLTKKRKYDYSIVIAFVFLLSLGYMYYYEEYLSDWFIWYTFTVVLFLISWLIVDNSILILGKNISGDEFKKLKNKLDDVATSAELIRHRFITTIELSYEGIMFRENGYIFATDKTLEYLNFDTNEMSVENFESKMHTDDVHEYNRVLEKLSKKYPTYTIKYRVKNGGNYRWIMETGKMIIADKKRSYIATVKPLDIRLFPKTDNDVLNELEGMKYLLQEMQRLSRVKTTYYLINISLSNIPKINEKFGRDFGDLMMAEYLAKLQFKFIKDSKSLFRINGINFGLIIKDKNKFDILSRALVGQGELFTMKMKFGGVSQTLYPNIGIAECLYGGKKADKVYSEAKKALDQTYKESYEKSYCFYKD